MGKGCGAKMGKGCGAQMGKGCGAQIGSVAVQSFQALVWQGGKGGDAMASGAMARRAAGFAVARSVAA
eukprot:1266081-Pleurochrysis_carterae.AAC.1